MNVTTLEQYFLQDYETTKADNECLRERVRELEAGVEYGVTDSHQKFRAVRGSTCSRWVIKDHLLKNGKMAPERMREVMALDDEALFNKYNGKTIGYCSAISYEEHEFQYTLHIKESRDEWTAVTDGKENSNLLKITPREPGEDLTEDEWYPIEEAEALKTFLARNLRETMEEALDEYGREQAEKEVTDDSAS